MQKAVAFLFAVIFLCMSTLSAEALTISSLVGDKDNFGSNLAAGAPVAVNQIRHTSADGVTDFWSKYINVYQWRHDFSLPTGYSIQSATLTIMTLDMEDAGAGAGLDDRLSLDSVEVLGAFDEVFTPAGRSYTPLTPNLSVFDLSPFLALLGDGSLEVALDTFGGSFRDMISIDYAELTIEAEERIIEVIPEPASLFLLGSGLLGILGLSRRTR